MSTSFSDPTPPSAPSSALSFTAENFAAREEGDYVVYHLGTKTFRLDKAKARARLAGSA